MVVSSPQRGEDTGFLSGFPIIGIHSYGILLVIPLELQEKSINYFLWHRQTKQPYAMAEPSKKALLPTWWKRISSAHYAVLNSPPQPAWGLPTPFPEPKTQRLPHGGRQALSSPPRRGHSPCGLPKGHVRGAGRCGIPVGAGRRGLGLEQMSFNVLQC